MPCCLSILELCAYSGAVIYMTWAVKPNLFHSLAKMAMDQMSLSCLSVESEAFSLCVVQHICVSELHPVSCIKR